MIILDYDSDGDAGVGSDCDTWLPMMTMLTPMMVMAVEMAMLAVLSDKAVITSGMPPTLNTTNHGCFELSPMPLHVASMVNIITITIQIVISVIAITILSLEQ